MRHFIEERLAVAGLRLPAVAEPRGRYVSFRRSSQLIFVAGQGPAFPDSAPSFGKVGSDLSLEEGIDAAKRTAVSVLAVLKEACAGDLDRIAQCIQLLGYVNSAQGFAQQSAVIDGASEVFALAFGHAGLAARAALAAPELPRNIAVELVTIFEIRQ